MSADEAKTAIIVLTGCLVLFAAGFFLGGGEAHPARAVDCTCHCDCPEDPR